MLSLSGTKINLKGLKVTVRQELTGKDASGESSKTDKAETGDKGCVFAVTGSIPYNKQNELARLFTIARAKEDDAKTVYRIVNKSAEALKINQVKF